MATWEECNQAVEKIYPPPSPVPSGGCEVDTIEVYLEYLSNSFTIEGLKGEPKALFGILRTNTTAAGTARRIVAFEVTGSGVGASIYTQSSTGRYQVANVEVSEPYEAGTLTVRTITSSTNFESGPWEITYVY